MGSTDELLEQIHANTREALHYARMRFLGTWVVVALLAMLTGIAIILATEAGKTNADQAHDIARVSSDTADAAKKQSEDTVAYLRGETGLPGVPGANGQNGTPGQPSSKPGPAGPTGSKGDTGDTGSPGPTGAIGTPGPTGATGAVGSAGAAGLDGTTGAPGVDGTVGATGPKGDIGPAGAKGDAGEKGAKGDAGPAGPRGDPGPAGATGPPGPAGPATPLTSVTVANASANDTTAQKNVQATCTTGRVTGGGYAILPATALIVPTTSSTVGNGWQVTANADPAFPGSWQVLAFAICST